MKQNFLKNDGSNLEEFEEKAKSWRRYKLKSKIEPKSLSDLIYLMIFMKYPSFTPRANKQQCSSGRSRSVEDVFRVAKYYHKDITLTQVHKAMKDLRDSNILKYNFCHTVGKYVHNPYSYTNTKEQISNVLGKLDIKFGKLE